MFLIEKVRWNLTQSRNATSILLLENGTSNQDARQTLEPKIRSEQADLLTCCSPRFRDYDGILFC